MATRQHHEKIPTAQDFSTSLHPITLAGGVVGACVTLGVVALIVRHNDLSPPTVRHLVAAGAGVACLWLVGPLLRFAGCRIVVRGSEIVVTSAWRSTRRAELGEIEGAAEHISGLGKWLGYGTVVIHGRNGTGATLHHVRDPERLCAVLRDRTKARVRRSA